MIKYELSEFRVVIVTGPQRSGTTITARIIAHDSSMDYVDESDYGTKNDQAWLRMVRESHHVVIQSPAMSHLLIQACHGVDDVGIVWVTRPLSEILASQERIGWNDSDERKKFSYYGADPIADYKLYMWRVHISNGIPWGIEVPYHDLEAHPLWVPDERRRDFAPRQWQEESLDGVTA